MESTFAKLFQSMLALIAIGLAKWSNMHIKGVHWPHSSSRDFTFTLKMYYFFLVCRQNIIIKDKKMSLITGKRVLYYYLIK